MDELMFPLVLITESMSNPPPKWKKPDCILVPQSELVTHIVRWWDGPEGQAFLQENIPYSDDTYRLPIGALLQLFDEKLLRQFFATELPPETVIEPAIRVRVMPDWLILTWHYADDYGRGRSDYHVGEIMQALKMGSCASEGYLFYTLPTGSLDHYFEAQPNEEHVAVSEKGVITVQYGEFREHFGPNDLGWPEQLRQPGRFLAARVLEKFIKAGSKTNPLYILEQSGYPWKGHVDQIREELQDNVLSLLLHTD